MAPRLTDLTGRRFGRLEILGVAQRKTVGAPICWVCQCECGKQTTVRGSSLTRPGGTESCGCLKGRPRAFDISGNVFSDWTVLFENPEKRGHWYCRCRCGKERYVYRYDLLMGKSTGCSCMKMQYRVKDLTGKRFGRLVVLDRVSLETDGDHRVVWRCQCDCGSINISNSHLLLGGNTKSCGCLWEETHHESWVYGSFWDKKTYQCWHNMLARCYNPKAKGYHNYGGQGVSVCDRWRDSVNGYICFVEDMGKRPSRLLSLDRIDPYGNYEPNNCRWATRYEQAINKRKSKQNVR